jgi:hypothetical protein
MAEQVSGSVGGVGGGREVAQTMYTHVSKCKNDKIKGEKEQMKSLENLMKTTKSKSRNPV